MNRLTDFIEDVEDFFVGDEAKAAAAPDGQPADPAPPTATAPTPPTTPVAPPIPAMAPAAPQATPVKGRSDGLILMPDEACINEIGTTPSFDLSVIETVPGVFDGVSIMPSWAQLEPSEGAYDFSFITNAFDQIRAWNAANPTLKPLTANKLRIYQGVWSPAYILAMGSVTLSSKKDGDPSGTHDTPLVFPLFWTDAYVARFEALIAALAAAFDGEPLLACLAISLCSSYTTEPGILPFSEANAPLLLAAGFTDAGFQALFSRIGPAYACWTQTQLDMVVMGQRQVQEAKEAASQSSDIQYVTATALKALWGDRLTLSNHGLDSPIGRDVLPAVEFIHAAGGSFAVQASSPTNDQAASFAMGLSYGMTCFEAWYPMRTIPLPALDVLQGWASQLAPPA